MEKSLGLNWGKSKFIQENAYEVGKSTLDPKSKSFFKYATWLSYASVPDAEFAYFGGEDPECWYGDFVAVKIRDAYQCIHVPQLADLIRCFQDSICDSLSHTTSDIEYVNNSI